MLHLGISDLSFRYGERDIFSSLSLSFDEGWHALAGANGSGKTTLLRLIDRQLRPTSGTITGNTLTYYCEQKLDTPPEGFDTFVNAYDARAYRLIEMLGIEEEWFYRWESLSYGERKRIQIAVALYGEPDILLLDEPTNHLDHTTRFILIHALRSYRGIGILVSHDRELMDTLCTHTSILRGGRVYSYRTPYTNAMREWQKERAALQKEHELHNQKIRSLQRTQQLQKEKVSRSAGRLSKRDIDPGDKDAKEKINLAKLTGRDRNDSRLLHTLQSRYEQLSERKIAIDKEYAKGIVIEQGGGREQCFPLMLEGGMLRLSGEKTLEYPDILIEATDKIALTGDNGTGKSSFIRMLLEVIGSKNLLYLPQEIDEEGRERLYGEIRSMPNDKKGELYTIVTRLASNPRALLDDHPPSPGELRKLLIAKALLENISLIILDEPTNHMDIDSITSLEEALRTYTGALILVSHDRVFVDAVAKRRWRIEKCGEGRYRLSEGTASA